jgi:hypothetical protein
VDQYIWGCTETATGSGVNKTQELEDGKGHGTGLRTATEAHTVSIKHIRKICLTTVKYHTYVCAKSLANELSMEVQCQFGPIKIKKTYTKIKYHSVNLTVLETIKHEYGN